MMEPEVDYATAFSNLDRESEKRQLDFALGKVLSMVDRGVTKDRVFREVDNLSIDRSEWFCTELGLYAEIALFIRETAFLREREKAE